jgi:transmembrane sensor
MKTFGPATPSVTHDAIARRAADYCQRRHFWEWSDADQAELDAWLAESFLHRAAYLRVEGTVVRTEQLAALRPLQLEPSGLRGDGRILRQWFVLPLLAAASAALFVALGIPFASSLMQPPDRIYSTDIGGRTLLTFADHTQIELNTDTVARFRMTGEDRTVWLDKGEAWFHVSHNAANPFTVIVGKHRVIDLGTEFLIRRGSDRMEVALLNGRATLSTEGAPIATLTPGDDAVATPGSMSVTRKSPQELADEIAWRRGVLDFRNTRLADAVREFNRYNRTKLVITDLSIADLKVSAEIKNDNVQGFLNVAETMLKLRADWQGNDILLSRELPERTKRTAHVKRSP